MVDLAEIGIGVDVAQVKTAKQELQDLSSGFGSAEASASVFVKAFDNATKTAQKNIEYLRKSSNAFKDSIEKALDITSQYKSAEESAKAFGVVLKNQEEQAKKVRAAVDSITGVSGDFKSAEVSARSFLEVLRNQEQQALQVASAINKISGVTGDRAINSGAGFGSLDAEMSRLESRFDLLKLSSNLYEKELNDLNAAQANGIRITGGYEAALEQLNLEYQQFQYGTANLSNRFVQFNADMQQSGKAARNFQLGIQQAGYQVGDFFVQVASGTNPMVAFTQQATQLAGFFAGPWGAAIGAGLSIVGAIGIAWMHIAEANDTATESAKAYENVLKRIADANAATRAETLGVSLGIEDQSLITIEFEKQALLKERNALATQQLNAENSKRIELNGRIVDLNDRILQYTTEQAIRKEALRQLEEATLVTKERESQYENQLLVAKARYGEQSIQVANLERAQYQAQVIAKQQLLRLSDEHVRKEMAIYDAAMAAKKEADALKTATENANRAAEIGIGVWERLKNKVAEAANQARIMANAALAIDAMKFEFSPGGQALKKYGNRGGTSPEQQDLAKTYDMYGNVIVKGVGGGGAGGGGGSDQYASNLQNLIESLQTEQETVDAWYESSKAILEDRRAEEILGTQAHNEALLALEEEYQRRKKEIQGAYAEFSLDSAATLFNELYTLSGSSYDKLLKVSKAFAASQALVDAWGAYAKTLRDGGATPWMRFAMAAKVLAAGLGAVNAIKGVGAGGSGATSASSATSIVPSTAQAAPQTYYIEGLDSASLYSGETLQNLFDAITQENTNRGGVFVFAKS